MKCHNFQIYSRVCVSPENELSVCPYSSQGGDMVPESSTISILSDCSVRRYVRYRMSLLAIRVSHVALIIIHKPVKLAGSTTAIAVMNLFSFSYCITTLVWKNSFHY